MIVWQLPYRYQKTCSLSRFLEWGKLPINRFSPFRTLSIAVLRNDKIFRIIGEIIATVFSDGHDIFDPDAAELGII